MDCRHRVYYLVNLNQNYKRTWQDRGYDNYGMVYDYNLKTLQATVSSLKIRPRGWEQHKIAPKFYQMMISCLKMDETDLLTKLGTMRYVNYEKVEG